MFTKTSGRGRVRRTTSVAALALSAALAYACSDSNDGPTEPAVPSTLVEATGDLTAKVTDFRALLGEPKNGGNVPGPAAAGRREISWDGVPAANTNTDAFPGNFFNSNVKNGLVMSTPGTGLRTSDDDFGDVNATYADAFEAFSPTKTFAAIGSNVIEVTFQVAGGTAAARVSGFGAVFSDVDRANTTKLEFYDVNGKKIGEAFAPVRSDAKGLSFVGRVFQSPLVARVRIILGQGAIGTNVKDVTDGGTLDLVVVDDFLYGEPQPY